MRQYLPLAVVFRLLDLPLLERLPLEEITADKKAVPNQEQDNLQPDQGEGSPG